LRACPSTRPCCARRYPCPGARWPRIRSHLPLFFLAEDGIRDFHVTGVQTCALPIFERATAGKDIRGDPEWWVFWDPDAVIVEIADRKSVVEGKSGEVGGHRGRRRRRGQAGESRAAVRELQGHPARRAIGALEVTAPP